MITRQFTRPKMFLVLTIAVAFLITGLSSYAFAEKLFLKGKATPAAAKAEDAVAPVITDLLLLFDKQIEYREATGEYLDTEDEALMESVFKITLKTKADWEFAVSQRPICVADNDSGVTLRIMDEKGVIDCPAGDCSEYIEEAGGRGEEPPAPLTDWPQFAGGGGTNAEVWSSPAVADLGDDGVLEVLVGSQDRNVYVYRMDPGAGGGVFATTAVDDSGGSVESCPAIGDIDGDGELEVVVTAMNNKVYAWDVDGLTGTIISGFPVALPDDLYSSAVLANTDDDDALEIIVAAEDVYVSSRDAVYIIDVPAGGPAELEQVFYFNGHVRHTNTPAVADLDGDGEIEIVIGDDASYVYAYKLDGTELFTTAIPGGRDVFAAPAIGDIDGDMELEIVVATNGGFTFLLQHDGTIAQIGEDLPSTIYAAPIIADIAPGTVNPNHPIPFISTLEIAVVDWAGNTRIYDSTGATLGSWNTDATDSSPSLADLNGDGAVDLIIGTDHDTNDNLVAVTLGDPSITEIAYIGTAGITGGVKKSTTTIVDFDQDGDVELLTGGEDGYLHLTDLETTFERGKARWPKYMHDLNNSGAYLARNGDAQLFHDDFTYELSEEKWVVGDRATHANIPDDDGELGHAQFIGNETPFRNDGIGYRKMYRKDQNMIFLTEFSFARKKPSLNIGLGGGRYLSIDEMGLNLVAGKVSDSGEEPEVFGFKVLVRNKEANIGYGWASGKQKTLSTSNPGKPEYNPNFPTEYPLPTGESYTAILCWLPEPAEPTELARLDVYLMKTEDLDNGSFGLNPNNYLVATWNEDSIVYDGYDPVPYPNELDYDISGGTGIYNGDGPSWIDKVSIFGSPEAVMLKNAPTHTIENLETSYEWADVRTSGVTINVISDIEPAEEDLDPEVIVRWHSHQSIDYPGSLDFDPPYVYWRDVPFDLEVTFVPPYPGHFYFSPAIYAKDGVMVRKRFEIYVKSSGSGCFLPGTAITLADGSLKPIEDIKVGDMVLSADEENNVVPNKVTELFIHPDEEGSLLVETKAGKQLRVTKIHRVMSDGEYKSIGELTIDSPMMILEDGKLIETTISSMRKVDAKSTVYNLEVENAHTYFAEDYLVHNMKPNVIDIGDEPFDP